MISGYEVREATNPKATFYLTLKKFRMQKLIKELQVSCNAMTKLYMYA